MFFVSHEVKILKQKMSFCDFPFQIANFCEFRPFFRDRGKSLPLDWPSSLTHSQQRPPNIYSQEEINLYCIIKLAA